MKRRMWWTLEEEEGFEELERTIGDPSPHFEVINDEGVSTGLLDAEGNEIPVADKQLGFLVFGEE